MGNSEKMTNKNCKVMLKKTLENIRSPWKNIPKFNKRRAFDRAVGPEKYPKLLIVGPTFIPESK